MTTKSEFIQAALDSKYGFVLADGYITEIVQACPCARDDAKPERSDYITLWFNITEGDFRDFPLEHYERHGGSFLLKNYICYKDGNCVFEKFKAAIESSNDGFAIGDIASMTDDELAQFCESLIGLRIGLIVSEAYYTDENNGKTRRKNRVKAYVPTRTILSGRYIIPPLEPMPATELFDHGSCSPITIIEDTKQKLGKHVYMRDWFRAHGIALKRAKLPDGDYVIEGYDSCVVDTKGSLEGMDGIDELYINAKTSDHDRFSWCMNRAIVNKRRLCYVVATTLDIKCIDDIRKWTHPYTGVSGDSLATTLTTMSKKYNTEFIFCTPEEQPLETALWLIRQQQAANARINATLEAIATQIQNEPK